MLSNNVQDILQDRAGFVWFATIEGLSRYDGGKFMHYFTVKGDSNTLSFPDIRRLLLDPVSDDIWVVTSIYLI